MIPNSSPRMDAVVGLYFRSLVVCEPAELEDWGFGASSGREVVVRVARIAIPLAEGGCVSFVGSVGWWDGGVETPLRKLFLGLYDVESPALSELVAAAAHYDFAVASLEIGHTFPLGVGSPLRDCGYHAALILGADLYASFSSAEATLGGESVRLPSVLPLTSEELLAKTSTSLDEFLARQEALGRDWLRVATTPAARGERSAGSRPGSPGGTVLMTACDSGRLSGGERNAP